MLAIQWQAARDAVERAGSRLTPQIFEHIRRVFVDVYASGQESPAVLTREWERQEFLRVVDSSGQPDLATAGMLEAFAETKAQWPDFGRWFCPAQLVEGPYAGQTALLANRWLCHLTGLHHLTVEIFIDPPTQPGFTLVQVRGMGKVENPGCFDLPCAGHISGLDGVEESLRKELGEELNLAVEDLEDMTRIREYDSLPGSRSHEYCYLYRGKLKASSVPKVAFADGEVAGLCVFEVNELRALIRRFPERVAGGLKSAMDFYEGESTPAVEAR